MTSNPKTVTADLLVKHCLETYRITRLLVSDDVNRPVGHIHDLVTLGM
jgi:hypothetical protein